MKKDNQRIKQNNIFNWVADRVQKPPFPSLEGKGAFLLSTYEELSLIVSIALLIVNILNYTQKK